MRNPISYARETRPSKYDIEFPLRVTHKVKFAGEGSGFVFYAGSGYFVTYKARVISCISAERRVVLWSYDCPKDVHCYVAGIRDDGLWVAIGNDILLFDLEVGNILLRSQIEGEGLVSVTDKYVVTYRSDNDDYVFRDPATLELVWVYVNVDRRVNYFCSYGNDYVFEGETTLTCCEERSVSYRWSRDLTNLLQGAFPERYRRWCERVGPNIVKERTPINRMGPMVDGVIYIGSQIGAVYAISLSDSSVVWGYEFPDDSRFVYRGVDHIIYKDGLLYVDVGLGAMDCLLCLDAKTGQKVFMLKDNFTPAGCHSPMIMGKYYIGGHEQHLAAFDVEAQEFVWRYQHRGVGIFGWNQPIENGLVVASWKDNTVYWLEPKKSKTKRLSSGAKARSTKVKPSVDTLTQAIRDDDEARVKQLLADGADPNGVDSQRATPLCAAVNHGIRWPIVRALLAAGADPAFGPMHPLVCAITFYVGWEDEESVIELLKLFVEHGLDVDSYDPGGRSLLHEAAYYDMPKVLAALVECGADVGVQDKEGMTVLEMAISSDSPLALAYLETIVKA